MTSAGTVRQRQYRGTIQLAEAAPGTPLVEARESRIAGLQAAAPRATPVLQTPGIEQRRESIRCRRQVLGELQLFAE